MEFDGYVYSTQTWKKVMHILPKGFKDNILPIKDIIYLEKNEKN